MKIIKIIEEINENKINGIYFPLKYEQIKVNNKIKRIINIKYIFLFYFIIIFLIYKVYFYNKNAKHILLKSFGKYIDDCKKFKIYNRIKFKNINPHFSICISALNMEKYIKKNIISIIKQSFQDLEIIIVDDNSKDNTKKIIKEMQIEDGRITIINHSQNLGVYRSRIESILNAKGKFIILMDPDDLYLNKNLFEELYNYNLINIVILLI
jgi:cellulose synthase/poly-beta-1,6-N-acetylglucosamine synthase-like glycosyltransferase